MGQSFCHYGYSMPMDWAFFLPSNPQGKVNEHHLQVPSILTHSPTPEGTFQSKWLLPNPCSAACRPLGYSNEVERGQSHSGGVTGDNLSRQLQILTWISPGPSRITSGRVMGTFYCCRRDKIQVTLLYYLSGC